MVRVISDFGRSVPSSGSNTLSRPIPASPARINLAEFGISISQNLTNVVLVATVGWQATAGTPALLFTIFRNQGIVFTTRINSVAVNESNTATFEAVDINPTPGFYGYSVQVEVPGGTLLNAASVIGPVTFTGTAIV